MGASVAAAVGVVAGIALVGEIADGVVLVVHTGHARQLVELRAIARQAAVNQTIEGVVLEGLAQVCGGILALGERPCCKLSFIPTIPCLNKAT